ncbi:MAG: type II secretion system protein [Gammaproteobacteria bacterium]|nr:type II secretion system protein [Gammaproteobacteria bacterium]
MKRVSRLRGVTLIELIVSIVVLSVAITGIVLAVVSVTQRSADPMVQEQASAIAQAYLEEVMLRPFCDPDLDVDTDPATPLACPIDCTGPVCGACRGAGAGTEAARPLYDDICDYDGLATSGAFDQTGAALPGLGGYQVTVEVVDSGVSLDGLAADSGQAALINVTVSHPALDIPVTLSAYKANY